ncbi:putative ribonuclease H-like domain-containing protein [Tanacetum coccineum]
MSMNEVQRGTQAPSGSKIYKRKPKPTTTPTKVLDFEESAERPINTASTTVNTGSTPSAQVTTVNTSAELIWKQEQELQELAGLEAAQRLQATMDAETQKQIDLDALLARRLPKIGRLLAEKLHQFSGVQTIMTSDGLKLKKKVLWHLELFKFVKLQLEELEILMMMISTCLDHERWQIGIIHEAYGSIEVVSVAEKICDKKLNVLFTEKECFVVSSDFKMPDENQVLLKVPRQHNMYTFDMKNVDSSKGYTCLLAKASSNEAKLWHRRLGHLNFKKNQTWEGILVRGLPSKSFKNDHTCVACQKGKQHKASCKAKIDRFVTHPLHTLHMDLFGPTSVRSINHASYCLVITDDCSRFCWVCPNLDEIVHLKTFIRQIENQLNQKVKIIRTDNGTEFKNRVMLEFCGEKGSLMKNSDEGFLVGYSVNSKYFRVYNLVTKRVEVNLHVNFLEEKPNVQGIGQRWMFHLDYLTDSMNYIPVSLQNQANPAGSKKVIDIDEQTKEATDLMVISSTTLTEATRKAVVSEKIAKKKTHSPKQPSSTPISKSADDIMTFRKELDALALKHLGPVPATTPTSTNPVNTGSDNLNTIFEEVTPGNIEAIFPSADHEEEVFFDADDDEMPDIRIYDKSSKGIFEQASYDDDGIITNFNNLPDEVDVTTNHTLRIHNAHPQSQILRDPNTPVQTRSSSKNITEVHALVSYIQAHQRSNHKDQQHCLFVWYILYHNTGSILGSG